MSELTNPALERLRAGEVSLGVGIRITGASAVARTMAIAGFDWLFIDLEHGSLGIETCANLSAAALDAGIAPLVRVPPGQNWMVTRVLEGGATGVVMPDVRSVDEARVFVDHVKYPPFGRRNAGGPPVHTGFTGRGHADLATMYNETTLAVIMLERPEAIALADDIAALDGVDVLMIGGGDLSAEMGIPGQCGEPQIVEAFETVCAACAKHGKWAGMGGPINDEQIQRYIEMGVQFILSGNDTGFLASAGKQRTASVRKMDPNASR